MTRRRIPDPLLTGDARFVADVDAEGALHAAFVRSPVAHARIARVDLADARRLATVCTADDLQLPPLPLDPGSAPCLGRPPLARDVVRFAGEPVAVVAVPPGDGLVVWVGTQEPFRTRERIAACVGLEVEQVRVVLPAIGGGFGGKLPTYAEHVVVAALALRLGAPVRYAETRRENLVAMIHGRGQIQDVEVGALRDGTIVGLRARIVLDAGAYPRMLGRAALTTSMLCGAYRIPQAGATVTAVVTNAPTTRAYRGVGRVEAAALVERAVDLVAAELRVDPLDVRRRNLLPADAYPRRTAAGARYDSGDLPRALDAATLQVDYHGVRREQRRRRHAGATPYLGVGIGAYVNVTGWESEYAAVEIGGDGRVTVTTGTAATGQQHAVAWTRLVERTLGIDASHTSVTPLDTAVVARGHGSWGSRSLQTAGSAVLQAAAAVRDRAVGLAARHWEVDPGDVAPHRDGARHTGQREAALSWAQLAALAGDEPLRAAVDFDQDELTAPLGVHVAVVEVDADTGRVRVIRYVAVDDCGRELVPAIVDGQIHGGVAQGIGEALYEGITYDANGTPSAATLRSYTIPSAPDLLPLEIVRSEVPAPGNPLGAKGVGESGVVAPWPRCATL